ncbi:MAG: alpha/beta hydrolase [bacterium]|nr:alpha/beta hydrolase [bacterium]
MKNGIILHGTGDSPDLFWFLYIKEKLEEKGFEVWLPQLPNARKPNLKDWLPFILENGKFTEETVIIGHSAGAQVVLSILENNDIKIKQAILVSGYSKPLPKTEDDPKNKDEFDWGKIKGKAGEFIFINSDNDPWQCTDVQGKIMADNLGGKLIVMHDGHMGSQTQNQPYKEFPLLLELI